MLSAKDENGKQIITAEQRTYFDGLNDNLKRCLNTAAEKETISRAEHLSILLSLQLRPQKMEILLQNNCILCHSDSANQSADTLFTPNPTVAPSHMDLKQVVEDVHFRHGISCAGCHGGDPAADLGHDHVKEWPEKIGTKIARGSWRFARAVIPIRRRCTSSIQRCRPISWRSSRIARMATGFSDLHDDRAPSCVSCHGVHGIRPAKDPQSKVYAQRVPETCGACHANSATMAGITRADGSAPPTTQTRRISHQRSRKALARGDLGAPALQHLSR